MANTVLVKAKNCECLGVVVVDIIYYVHIDRFSS